MALPHLAKKRAIELSVPYFEKDKRLHLLICDCGFGAIDSLKRRFPGRCHHVGIMEQATVSIAAGMASEGLRPVIYAIAQFITHRALEQLYLSLVCDGYPVKIIGVGCGDTFRALGRSHTVEDRDIALCRAIGLDFINTDNDEKRDIDVFYKTERPCYLRTR